ncbi:MAG: 4Fe-4S dicluster domain-containing protein, partial [Gemmata sp.]
VGPRQPAWVHALAHSLNDALGNYTAGVAEFRDAPPEALDKGLADLAGEMALGRVSTLVIIGGNPVFNAPADARFAEEMAKVPTTIRLGLFFDHTSEKSTWHLPLAHHLEGWSDTESSDGGLCCVQPLIAPLNGHRSAGADAPARGGRTAVEVLALLLQAPGPDEKPVTGYAAAQKAAYHYVRRAFSERTGLAPAAPNFDEQFNRYKQLGFLPAGPEQAKALGFAKHDERARAPKPVGANHVWVAAALAAAPLPGPPNRTDIEVTFHPSYALSDGRGAMNPWLQELPDPITKLVWDNAALISPATAKAFNISTNDIVEVKVGERTASLPALVLPGQADFCVALAYGHFGQMRIAHVPHGGGTDVFPLRRQSAMHTATYCKLERTARRGDLVVTQEHGHIPEGRDVVRDLDVNTRPETGERPHAEPGPKSGPPPDGRVTGAALKGGFQGGYGNAPQGPAPAAGQQQRFPLDLARPELLDSQFQWGMVIDLAACTGCSACVVACQAENNIPVVGKHEVKRNREMHWLRIDHYFLDGTDDPRVAAQPVACVHCEAAPCEQVCPVSAAVHSPEGLNLQVYNRCIGTRYCSNACPYKVRRFNWFDFNKRRLDELRVPTPLARGGASRADTGVPETLKMQKNPDVSVRMRGVMEKSTYCVQRVERGKYGAKIAATEVAQGRRTIPTEAAYRTTAGAVPAYKKPQNPRAAGYDLDSEGRVIVPDGTVVTACEAACPSRAITFGNTLDPASRVAQLKAREREYLLLGELNTKPRTSYLPRLRNLNTDLL